MRGCVEQRTNRLRGSTAHQREVALVAQMPEDVAGPGAVRVVNLDHPILMAHRKNQIAVTGGEHRVRVRPIRKEVRVASHVQMIECIPNPNWIQIGIKVNDLVAQNSGRSGKAG